MAVSDVRSFVLPLIPLMCLAGCSPSDDVAMTAASVTLGGETGMDSISTSTTNTTSTSNGDGDGAPGDGDGDGDGDPGDGDSDTTGTKFDLAPIGDAGGGQGSFGPGSCRASETYGASGNFPQFEDPAYADFLDRTVAIVTHNNWDGPPNNFSLTIVDISGAPPPPNMNYLAPLYHRPEWTLTGPLGKNFGLTLDSVGNIYLAATTVWGANSTPNQIKKIDGVTGEITVFATLPNNGPAFGNINYDCVSESFYVSNHEDGRIYQIDYDGDVVSTYKHSTSNVTLGLANDPGEPNGAFAPVGERPWAVQSHAGRLYYSIWATSGAHSVWSVAYEGSNGIPDPSTRKMEFTSPGSQPVSDLSFAHSGWMLISQRTMNGDMQTGAHQSTTFEYDYQNGSWVSQGTTYVVGELLPYSATGGVDHDFVENGYVWMTGDALDFYTPNVVYGLQGTPHGGGGIEVSTLIDLDHEVTQQDKTVYGDVELPIPGDVSPVPPPG